MAGEMMAWWKARLGTLKHADSKPIGQALYFDFHPGIDLDRSRSRQYATPLRVARAALQPGGSSPLHLEQIDEPPPLISIGRIVRGHEIFMERSL